MRNDMRIAIIGAGYVGLVSGVGLAKHGNEVAIVDIDHQRVSMINQAKSPFHEEGLQPLMQDLLGCRLRATADIRDAINGAEVIFICVQTITNHDGDIDLAHVKRATMDIGTALNETQTVPLVVVKSTVVPGTTEKVVCPLLEKCSGQKLGTGFRIACNPEFLREGKALADFLKPDRVIIGENDTTSGDILAQLYRDFGAPILRVDLKTAEMIKYASNAFLATKISFINEIGNICKGLGIDVSQVAEGIALDARISPHFLNAGIGFGGSCLPKDVKALASAARAMGYHASLLESVLSVNEKQPLRLVEIAEKEVGSLLKKRVAILGLAFKPGTDDIREAPSIRIITELLNKGARVTAYDPMAASKVREIFGDRITYTSSATAAVAEAELVFIITEWDEFRDPGLYQGKKVFEGRKVLKGESTKNLDCEGICW